MAVAYSDRPQLNPATRRLLGRLRAEIRRYVTIEGIALTVVVLCAAFWGALGIDWIFEPSAAVRRGLLCVGLIAGVITFYQFVIRRLAVPLSDARLALLLERRFRYFDDSLLTSIDLAESDQQLGPLAIEMLAHTCRAADDRAADVRVSDVFDPTPRRRAVGAAAVLIASVAICAVAIPATLVFGASRLAGLTDEAWPRRTRLVAHGFDSGEIVVARGDDVEVLVQADTKMPLVPDVVQIRSRNDDGVRSRDTMTRVGNATADDEFQDFRYKFGGVLTSLSFDVLGGDARLSDLRIRVVDSPTLRATVLGCEYPAYMNRSPRDVPVTGAMQIPVGTRITVRAEANKELVEVRVEYPTAEGTAHIETIALAGPQGGAREFQFTLPPLDADKTIQLSLVDTDGIRKPFALPIVAVFDQPPQVSLQLRGIGTAITPAARLPLAGTITDDYGVASAIFTVTVDEKETHTAPFAAPASSRSEIDVDEAFEVRDLKLKPGQKVLFGAQAADAYHLTDGDQPHTSPGARFALDVVSAEALRAMLESRELNLRQRFEQLMAEVIETRDLLSDTPALLAESAEEPASDTSAGSATTPPAGAAKSVKGPSAEYLRVERARQNAEKNGQETAGIAASFDEIREELINNRVDTEELRIRLKDRIADPLRVIANDMFPEWDRRLKTLQKEAENPAAAPAARRSAVEQADTILVELARVRDMMLELESFNEAVDMLRSIIGSEKALQERIRERQKSKVRDLLEDEK